MNGGECSKLQVTKGGSCVCLRNLTVLQRELREKCGKEKGQNGRLPRKKEHCLLSDGNRMDNENAKHERK